MIYGLICIGAAVVILVMAERCRRLPERCKDSFMSERGVTRSFVALRYLGRSTEARDAIVTDYALRRLYLMERYFVALFGVIVGVFLIVSSL